MPKSVFYTTITGIYYKLLHGDTRAIEDFEKTATDADCAYCKTHYAAQSSCEDCKTVTRDHDSITVRVFKPWVKRVLG